MLKTIKTTLIATAFLTLTGCGGEDTASNQNSEDDLVVNFDQTSQQLPPLPAAPNPETASAATGNR